MLSYSFVVPINFIHTALILAKLDLNSHTVKLNLILNKFQILAVTTSNESIL